jgi:PIN domain nuclease of toxin-antitoxin system
LKRILLDTHALIWWLTDDPRIGRLRQEIEDSGATPVLSTISLWEIQFKVQAGKIRFDRSVSEIQSAFESNGFGCPLPFEGRHVATLEGLPSIHKDPFDRALVAQAICEGLVLATHDTLVLRYPVLTLAL